MCANYAHMGTRGVQGYNLKIYNLDIILIVGYRTNSKQCIAFRLWANSVLNREGYNGQDIRMCKQL